MRGVFINQKAYINKRQYEASRGMLKKITNLEAQHKLSGEDSIKRNLDVELSKLKLLQASQAAMSVMYSRI